MTTLLFTFLILVTVIIGIIVVYYNRLIQKRNAVANARAQIDIQLTRRCDLIPNLTTIADRFLTHERELLTTIAQNRTQQSPLTTSQQLSHFTTQIEAYPNIKADAQLAALTEALKSTENRVAFANQHYQDTVNDYNDTLQTFPTNQIGRWFGFTSLPQEPPT